MKLAPFLLIALGALLFPQNTRGAEKDSVIPQTPWNYFRPAWEQSGINAEISGLLNDPQGRVEPEFRIPPSMRKRVLFWTLVYGHYDSRMRVVHDKRDPGILYGVIDFSPLFASRLSAVAREKKMRLLQSAIMEELRRRLIGAFHNVDLATVTERERDQWRHFLLTNGVGSAKDLKKTLNRIRTQTGQRDMFEGGLKRADALLPEMERIFRDKGLPVSLTKIPFVESSFNSAAISKAGAFGIWQFTPRTAKDYLKVDDNRNPLVQTMAAAVWLRRFRKSFPNWEATVTAYNSGTRNVSRMMSGARRLGFAGQNYFSEVLAANLVEVYKTWFFAREIYRNFDQQINCRLIARKEKYVAASFVPNVPIYFH